MVDKINRTDLIGLTFIEAGVKDIFPAMTEAKEIRGKAYIIGIEEAMLLLDSHQEGIRL